MLRGRRSLRNRTYESEIQEKEIRSPEEYVEGASQVSHRNRWVR